jgi:hypothetical protein
MLHLFPAEIPRSKSKAIQDWLGQQSGRDFVDYLVLKDAEETALAANKFIESADAEVESEDAKGHREQAIFLRKVLDLLSEMRKPDFKFEYQKVEPKPATTQPPTEE